MDPLSALASVIGVYQIFESIVKTQTATLGHTYGRRAAFLMSIGFRNTVDEYERVERVVLKGGDEEALAFRQSVTDECNMTAIAVSHC